jgi:hypothetical protein
MRTNAHACTSPTHAPPPAKTQDLSLRPLDCEPDDIFRPQLFTPDELQHWVAPPIADGVRMAVALLPPPARRWLEGIAFVARPMQIHAAVLAVFASFVAPFGAAPRGGPVLFVVPAARAKRP